jgi:8-oxo-dGTP pyrophosphatase MutT (NUDIX family)
MVDFACVALVDPRGWVLMQERDAGARRWPGLWGFPGGGVESGESGLACAVRELREETGLRIDPGALASLGVYPVEPGEETWELFVARTERGDDDVECHEGRRMVFVDPARWATMPLTGGVGQVAPDLAAWCAEHPPRLGERRFAGVLLLDRRGHVLLQERDEHPRIDPERWGLPGGHVDPGETFEAAAPRELEEETGVRLPAGALRLWREFVVDHRAAHGTWDRMQVFVAEADLTDDDIDCREGRRIVFVAPEDATGLPLTSAAAQILPTFLEGRSG